MTKATKEDQVDLAENGRQSLDREDPEKLRHYYYQMLLLRRFEERTSEMYIKAKIGGYCHLNLGEEATIVGLMTALEPDDYIFTNYREHGYIIARGVEPGAVMAELFGRETGVSGGRGGSMHLFDFKAHFMGGYAIVGGQMPLAIGAAYALKYQGKPGVVVCQVGDATTNIGAWHESLNLAKLYQLPVLFFIVNNGFGMGTTVEEASAEPDLWKKGCAHRIHGEQIDGTDLLTVRDATRRLRQRAEQEGEPAIMDVISYPLPRPLGDRLRIAIAIRRRSSANAQRHDPVLKFAKQLIDAGVGDEGWLKETEKRVDHEVQEAIDFADRSAPPKMDDLYQYMYATEVPNILSEAERELFEARLNAGGR